MLRHKLSPPTVHHFSKIKSQKESQNSRNQGFSYYFCMMIEGSGSIPLTSGSRSGSGRPQNMWIWGIRIRNTVINNIKILNTFQKERLPKNLRFSKNLALFPKTPCFAQYPGTLSKSTALCSKSWCFVHKLRSLLKILALPSPPRKNRLTVWPGKSHSGQLFL